MYLGRDRSSPTKVVGKAERESGKVGKVLVGKAVLKICSKFTGEHTC